MAHLPTDHSDVPIRLFKSDFLEFFSHISPITVLVIWLPVALFFLIWSIAHAPAGGFPVVIPLGFLVGLFLWTLAEYVLHRFLFHMPVKGEKAERIIFLFHGVHHAQPQLKTRLVMPPVISIPLAAIFYALFYLFFAVILKAAQWVAPVFSAFIFGYLLYDLTHYATHHFPMRGGYAKYIKRYHMQHHYKTPNARFGVSSPLWDKVFKTMPE
ncbi:MAG TPA: sterol desaturase family protein [Anaerolineaceae bacterium]|jgi:sterol desaturase/sphingolipid hydroxylase (fatty acid hydroxylase superfamily)|nr:fatty acid hydroxylase [Chloroflexota bacterium]HNS06384.1 sterol desaturase family protein [Anaerolineaceae bacterium]HOQ69300.1 sterol desaturase family protein [Anaerolineaceae bacterium]HOS53121.1 sterol desaturase family protein [Anaerolineaceae bacterium]HPD62698.1 sterol desaturase family protein [Anaerolineaceae bacterium]